MILFAHFFVTWHSDLMRMKKNLNRSQDWANTSTSFVGKQATMHWPNELRTLCADGEIWYCPCHIQRHSQHQLTQLPRPSTERNPRARLYGVSSLTVLPQCVLSSLTVRLSELVSSLKVPCYEIPHLSR